MQRPSSARASASAGLSPGALRTLELLASGLYTDEVAERLCADPGTIRSYVDEAKARLAARSKLEAVDIAVRAGMIDPPGGVF